MMITVLLATLAALSGAMPLRKGNTWTWQVLDRHAGYLGWRTAILLDSTPVDSGTSWHLLVRDSTTGSEDTATLLAKRDGRQCWTRTSGWAPWDPAPPTAKELSRMAGRSKAYTLIQDSEVSWGGSFLAAESNAHWGLPAGYSTARRRLPDNTQDDGIYFQTTLRAGIPAFLDYRGFEWSGTATFPAQKWSDSLGFVQGRRAPDFDWSLLSFNGNPVDLTAESWRLPTVGDSMAWDESTSKPGTSGTASTTRQTRIWRITGILAQTDGSVKVQYQESILDSEGAMSTNPRSIVLTPGVRDLESLPYQARGWVALLCDLPDDSGSSRIYDWSYTNVGGGPMGNSESYNARFDLQGNLVDYAASKGSWSRISLPYQSSFTSTTIHRLDADFLASVRSARAKTPAPSNLDQLAALHPDLPVRWTDARGHRGRIPASSFRQRSPESGVLFLDATLPDGTTWRAISLGTAR